MADGSFHLIISQLLFISGTVPALNNSAAVCWLLGLIILAAAILVNYRMIISSSSTLTLPPGPRGLPIVGSLFLVRSILQGSKVTDLQRKYGPIITLQFGSGCVILVMDSHIASEALVEKGSIFSSRPPPPIFAGDLPGHTVSFSPYGPVWRSLRRNIESGVLSPGHNDSFKGIREKEMERFVCLLEDQALKSGGIVPLLSNCEHTLFNIALYMCFGRQFPESTLLEIERFISSLDDSASFFPQLFINQEKALRREQTKVLSPLLYESRKLLEQGKLLPDCYVYTLLTCKTDQGEQPSEQKLLGLCLEFMFAVKPVAVSIEWAIANIINQPNIQFKLASELERVLNTRGITEEDLDKLPYLRATVKETLRIHPPNYITLPHAITRPCKLGGYDIPMHAHVLFHLEAIAKNPTIWQDNPSQFKPERFMGVESANSTESKYPKMMPFGAGIRRCPGSKLATLHTCLLIGCLVQAFQWNNSSHSKLVDLTKDHKLLTVKLKTPLMALITKRKTLTSPYNPSKHTNT